jgi:hypothetical protein
MRSVAAVLVLLLAVPPVALADEPPPPGEGASMQPPDPDPTPPPAEDEAELATAYDAAFEALIAGDYDAAIAGFEAVAARTQHADRRAAASEMLRLALRMKAARSGGQATPDGRLVLDQGGRAQFVAATTIASFYGSFVLLDTFGVDDYRPSIAMVTGVTAAGFLGSLYGTRGRRISTGMAESYTIGIWSGVSNGLLLSPVLGVDVDGEDGDGEVNDNFLTFGLVMMAAGGAAGAYLGHRYEPTGAQARYAGTLAVNGFITAGLGMIILQPDFEDEKIPMATLAIGMDIGLVAGISSASKIEWSGSRLTYVTLAEFLGGLGGFAISGLVVGSDPTEEEGRAMAVATLGGMWGGFALGIHMTRDMEPDSRFARTPAGGAGASLQLMPVALGKDARGIGLAGTF